MIRASLVRRAFQISSLKTNTRVAKCVYDSHRLSGAAIRNFSSENSSFRETLEKIKKNEDSKESGGEKTADDASSNGNEKVADEKANEGPDIGKVFEKTSSSVSNIYESIVSNVKLAWSEMLGETKETTLRRTVQQAASFRRADQTTDADGEELEKYDGPTAIVVVKDRGSAWDQMKARLSSSPLIREMLKNTSKVTKAAAQTDIGKKAVEAGQSVKHKLEVL
jgi:hypothetical protein